MSKESNRDLGEFPPVSIIIAVRNEQEHLDRCLDSIVNLDYPADKIEIILVDGMSTDNTVTIIEKWIGRDSRIRMLKNPKRIVSAGMNIGLKESRHDLILWTSGHVCLERDYLRKCVNTMRQTGAAAVGGILRTVGHTAVGKINALILSSRFGVGIGKHRIGGKSGWVAAVTMALYGRDAIVRAGGWDESIARSQDNDLHDRMNRAGDRSYINVDASVEYNCRETYSGLLKQAWNNGYWNVMLKRMGRGGFRLMHYVPMAFVGSLMLLGLGAFVCPYSLYFLIGLLGLYGLIAASVSLIEGLRRQFTWQVLLLPFWFLSLHLSYGLASWAALFQPVYKPHDPSRSRV